MIYGHMIYNKLVRTFCKFYYLIFRSDIFCVISTASNTASSLLINIYELPHDKTNKITCMPSEDSDAQADLLRSDWMDAQADLSLHSAKVILLYPPQTMFVGGILFFTLSVHPSFRPSVRDILVFL